MVLKKYVILLLFVIIAICAVSTVNAADINVSDEISSENVIDDNLTAIGDDLSVSEPAVEVKAAQKSDTLEASRASKQSVNISAKDMTAVYKSGKLFKVKVMNDKKAVEGVKLKVKVYTGKKAKTHILTTDSKGIVSLNTSNLKAGNHKVVIGSYSTKYVAKSVTSSIKIKPKPLKLIVAIKNSKYFSTITIKAKNKSTKEYVNGVRVKILIYTGKKYKTVKLKTGKYQKQKGVAKYLTNMQSYGAHKVKIQIYGNYKGSASGKMVIHKKARMYYKAYGYFSNSKAVSYIKYKDSWIKTRLI